MAWTDAVTTGFWPRSKLPTSNEALYCEKDSDTSNNLCEDDENGIYFSLASRLFLLRPRLHRYGCGKGADGYINA